MEMYFNMHKIKYATMVDIFNEYGLDNDKPVSLFINLNPIINLMTTPSCIEYLKIRPNIKHIEFISSVLNLAAHYKAFFIRQGQPIKIYLYTQYPFISDNQLNRIYNPEYRVYSQYRYTNDVNSPLSNIISGTINNIKTISTYIKDVYFIESNNIESSLIPKILYDDKRINIILSNDLYDFQYVNHDFKILISKQNQSVILDNKTIMNYIRYKEDISKEFNIGSNFLPFIISIYGDKYRNIYKIKGFGMKSIFKYLHLGITRNAINPNTDNIDLLLDVIKSSYKKEIKNNFFCTDISHQYNKLSIVDINMVKNQIIDRYDPSSLNDINNKFFELYPLQLVELTSELIKTKKSIKF